MKLTTKNAKEYKGKKLDSKTRLHHYYPLEVKQRQDGEFYYKDSVGVCMKVPEPTDGHNAVYFDFILGESNPDDV